MKILHSIYIIYSLCEFMNICDKKLQGRWIGRVSLSSRQSKMFTVSLGLVAVSAAAAFILAVIAAGPYA